MSTKDMKKKNNATPFTWSDSGQNAFETLKEKLPSPPILAYADYRRPF